MLSLLLHTIQKDILNQCFETTFQYTSWAEFLAPYGGPDAADQAANPGAAGTAPRRCSRPPRRGRSSRTDGAVVGVSSGDIGPRSLRAVRRQVGGRSRAVLRRLPAALERAVRPGRNARPDCRSVDTG